MAKSIKSDELILANKKLALQNKQIAKRAAELVIANKELAFQNKEKEKRAVELIAINKELAFQHVENEKCTIELITANGDLKKSEGFLKDYIEGLEELMFMTSHKVRNQITNILGVSDLLGRLTNSPEETKKMVGYIKKSAQSLNTSTKELTTLMSELEQKGKKNLD